MTLVLCWTCLVPFHVWGVQEYVPDLHVVHVCKGGKENVSAVAAAHADRK